MSFGKGTKNIAIKSIAFPGNFAATKAAARVLDLATSVREHGLIHLPVVRRKGKSWQLVAGHDRLAALIALKEKEVEVRTWEGSERDFQRTQIAENLHRRSDDDRARLIAEYTQQEEKATYDKHVAGGDTVPSTQSVKAESRKKVAAVAGVKPEALKKREQRARAAASSGVEKQGEPSRGDAAEALALPAGFEDFGLPMSEHDRAVTIDLIEQLKEWEQGTANLLGELTRVEKGTAEPVLAPALAARIREAARTLGHVLRNAVPTGRCAYCKGKSELRAMCTACGTTGLAGRHANDNAPKELLAGGPRPLVAVNGRFVPYHEVAPAEVARPKANGRGKGINVELPDGRVVSSGELTVELDEAY
jgi:ParB-like chromosome segregation protein Spo0J